MVKDSDLGTVERVAISEFCAATAHASALVLPSAGDRWGSALNIATSRYIFTPVSDIWPVSLSIVCNNKTPSAFHQGRLSSLRLLTTTIR